MIHLEKLSAGHEPDERNTKSLQKALKRYCLALTQSSHDAEDLAQDTWVKALAYMNTANTKHTNDIKQTSYTSHPNPEALLLRIARNTWTDIVRRKSTLSRVLELEQSRTEEAAAHGSFEIEGEPVMAVSSYSFQTIQSGGFSSTGWSYAEPGMWMVA